MSHNTQLNIKQIFDLAFENQSKKNFKVAKKLYEKIIEIDPNIINAQFNLGTIYQELNENEKAINCYEKVINIDPLFIPSYNNLGLIFRNLGENNKAIKYFKRILDINFKYPSAYNNLGLIYADVGNYKQAIDHYITALKYDCLNKFALNNLILSLNYFLPNTKHPIIEANNKLKKISNNLNINQLLKHNNLKAYFKDVYKIKNKINDNIKFFDFAETQVFRKNSFDLNCERHHKVFNKANLIPKFCFSCFKIQIEPKNVLELIKLLLIFR
jgi:tetratricopeptide (TPR) repeat protein